MNLEERIKAFSKLGKQLNNLPHDSFNIIVKKAGAKNPWFTPKSIQLAISGVCNFLIEDKLRKWTSHYNLAPVQSKSIGVAMAGNIPLVGFHDYLSILITGHIAQIKLSSQDSELLPWLHTLLVAVEPRFESQVIIVDRLHQYEAAIATGSDNTARYFSYYFKHVPHIIRKNRSSCGILIGGETEPELESLGKDVFTYFGLGCRNISKLYIPTEYDLVPLLRVWEKFVDINNHNKYGNNYTYQRSIHLMNLKHFYDNGAVLLIEDEKLVSPISTVYYERYTDQEDLKTRLQSHKDKLQCVVSAKGWFKGSLEFGKTQTPELWDYADNVDTVKFLSDLN